MGRTPFDVTDSDEVKQAIQRRIDAVIAEWMLQEALKQAERDRIDEMKESSRLELAQRRFKKAVNIVISGAVFSRINGTYAPMAQESDDWPMYSKMGDRDILLYYVYPEWIIQNVADRFSIHLLLIQYYTTII